MSYDLDRNFDVRLPSALGFEAILPEDSLGAHQRGLVISPPITVTQDALQISTAIDPNELRFSLLFWDQLAFPNQNSISLGSDGDAKLLEDAGIIVRPRIRFVGGGNLSELYLKGHLFAFQRLDEREPGRWSFARGERSISYPPSAVEPDRGILFKLFEILPVPDEGVRVYDILEFKDHRRDELLNLRHHLERIYQSIASTPDRALDELTEIEALDKALHDHIVVSRESGLRMRMSGLQAKIGLGSVGAGVGAFKVATSAGLPLSQSLLSGLAGAAAASLGLTVSLKGRTAMSNPFEYISTFSNEVLAPNPRPSSAPR